MMIPYLAVLKMTLSQNLGKQTLPGANAKLSSDFCQLNYVIIEKISIVDQYFFGTSTIDRNR